MKQLPLGVRLRTAAVFENFHAGPNLEALEALRSGTDPLWIWGPPASGKTHVLQAACAASEGPCAYIPIADGLLPPAALEGLENLTLLCIDDVERAAGVEAWERALFRLFNAALETRCRLVFAARLAPGGLPWNLPDWASRAGACRIYQLRLLEDAGRIEALRLRAEARGLELPRETAEYLLRRMPRDQRTLFDLVDALDEASLVAQRRLTVPFVRDALKLP
ncbi:MAG: DnaA regulatory inactivator Hda [Steroidobacteraceae bacterium]